MKIIIVDQKHGDTRSLVLKDWMRFLLTICFFGMPVLLGYYGYQFSASRSTDIYTDEAAHRDDAAETFPFFYRAIIIHCLVFLRPIFYGVFNISLGNKLLIAIFQSIGNRSCYRVNCHFKTFTT